MQKINTLLTKVLPYSIALFVGFAGLRVYEFFHLEPAMRISFKVCLQGMWIDLFFALLITGVYFVVQLILGLFKIRIMLWIMVLLSLLALLVNFVLIQYFFATKMPLDEAIYFFSLKELKLIVGSENRVSGEVILVIGSLLIGYFLLIKLLQKIRLHRILLLIFGMAVVATIVFPSLTYADDNQDHKKAVILNNRLAYFAHRSAVYFTREEAGKDKVKLNEFEKLDPEFYGGKSISREYPLLHKLPKKSEFASFFKKSPKGAPNIVFIMVESLSTSLVGDKADKTGHLLPFLDSLSKESLYWPNFLSTCDRTHNVLPASLASVPYTTKGNIFQQLEFPGHWSLFSLLNKEYYTRFYCGVDLNFSNMNGYMNYYQTDYIVKDWEKRFSGKFSDRETPWGFPDGALFDKSWLDYKKQKLHGQKRIDVLLTISTHDPFVIPREKYYTDRVLKSIAKIKNPTAMHRYVKQNAYKFASFVYTDDQLRNYFNDAKNNPDFDNTIFLIYGDHGTELCVYDELSRFKIPLIIYSPLLKKTQTFRSVSTQLDLAPTLLNYLRLTYGMELPSSVPFLGKELSYVKRYECKRALVLGSGRLKGEHVLYDNYFMFLNELYRVKNELEIVPVKNEKAKRKVSEQRKMCDLMADYTIYGNKILPEILTKSYTTTEEFKAISQYTKKKPSQQELSEEFIRIGKDMQLPQNTKYVRIQFDCDYWNETAEKVTELPKLTLSLEHAINGKSELIIWKQIDYHQSSAFRKKAWNHLSATITVRMSDYQKMSKENTLKYYLLNAGKTFFNIKNVEVKILKDK